MGEKEPVQSETDPTPDAGSETEDDAEVTFDVQSETDPAPDAGSETEENAGAEEAQHVPEEAEKQDVLEVDEALRCGNCGGSGRVTVQTAEGLPATSKETKECSACHGSGKKPDVQSETDPTGSEKEEDVKLTPEVTFCTVYNNSVIWIGRH